MAHYRNIEREQQIAELRLNKHLRLKTIGDMFGISPERTRQILVRYTKENRISLLPYEAYKQQKAHLCPTCGHEIYDEKEYCSRKCFHTKRHNDTYIIFNCEMCGELHSQKQSVYNRSHHHYCSKECFGSFIGRNFGFKKTPNNIKANMIRQA